LSHILFWPLFGPLAICIVFPILILIVSCKTCNVPTYLFMHGLSSIHFATFIIS
jgi:hypothetical protein